MSGKKAKKAASPSKAKKAKSKKKATSPTYNKTPQSSGDERSKAVQTSFCIDKPSIERNLFDMNTDKEGKLIHY